MQEQVIRFLENEIAHQNIPGGVISVSQEGKPLIREALGNRRIYPEKLPMKIDTVFDLASLTKVVVTLPAVLKLIDQGLICLEDKVSHYIPEFSQHNKGNITIAHLLTHTSGLPAHKQFYQEQLSVNQVLEQIYAEKLIESPGSKVIYSDLGFITLFKIVEVVTAENFKDYVQREILTPLEMTSTGFNPTFSSNRYAVTEYQSNIEDYKCGIVHDDNTESMGGISGHAGLFSTVDDLEKFAIMIENNGMYKGKKILSKHALELARQSRTPFDVEQRGLGWMLKSPSVISSGDYFSNDTYGHTGFTGTSIWFDPKLRLNVIFLTNRVHFGRGKSITRLRARLHNLILSHF